MAGLQPLFSPADTPQLFTQRKSLFASGSPPSGGEPGASATPVHPSAAAAAAAGDDRVKVVVRIRPPSEREALEPACLQHTGVDTLTLLSSPEPAYFTLDHVAGAASTQHHMFKVVGRPIVENALAGFNSTIFAYGQTGSGKVRARACGPGWLAVSAPCLCLPPSLLIPVPCVAPARRPTPCLEICQSAAGRWGSSCR
jgi:hypothetical protein